MNLLTFDNVNLSYKTEKGTISVLKNISLRVRPGEFITIVGPSGCGKSSLLKLAEGIISPSGGTVFFEDKPVSGISSKVGIMLQDPNLFPWLTVKGNVEFGPKRQGVDSAQRDAMTHRYLEQMGLEGFANYKPYELSGGMKQRVALARTLINNPKLLLMDEPFGSLDKLTKENMQASIKELWKRTGKTFLFVTHDVDEAVKLGTRLIVMSPRPGVILKEITVDCQEQLKDGKFGVDKQDVKELVYQLLVDAAI